MFTSKLFDFYFILFFELSFFIFVGRESARDVHHGEHCENKRLQATAEEVKIERKYRGYSDLQEGYLTEDTREPAEQER